MDFSKLRRSLGCAAVVAGLGLCGNAAAVVYSSTFDPPNFNGTATFDVSQGCLDVGNGFAINHSGTCTVTWLSAVVNFTDAPGLTFSYASLLPDSDIVFSVWIDDGELGGVRSGALGPVIISGSSNSSFNGPWWIQFEFEPFSDLFSALDGPPSSGLFGFGVVYLYTGTCTPTDIGAPICTRNQDPIETAHVENFTRVTQVPEPGTLVLILGAVAGAWLARRRASNAV
jgi:PEP-CTERM motif